jgi:asparagine synthetase B (glutamine-hydrolysing)
VPYCDHRLVEYVFNTPWSYKTYDGREKSLLRGAVADALPESVVRRVKSPYPATQNASYEEAIRKQLTDVLTDSSAPIQPYLNTDAVREALRHPVGNSSLQRDRIALERAVTLNDWLTAYRPVHV